MHLPPPERGIYCNRTLNLRAIRAIGYDMDYTLVHYNVHEWERCAYGHLRSRLADLQWPVVGLEFDPHSVIRGLIIDRDLGNIVKANRFGYVMRACHGTHMLSFEAQKRTYSTTVVDLSDKRFVFLNTLFSLSEAAMYAQLVDLLDAHRLPGVMGYADLYDRVRAALDVTHMEGQLKAEITADPERFVELDPDAPLALLDQRNAGKKLLLITNSDWAYTQFMMAYAYDRFLPAGTSWRDLFHLAIVSAGKPSFFWSHTPIFEVVDQEGLLRPSSAHQVGGGVYVAGNAEIVERSLALDGSDILFVGDHIYADVNVSKNIRRWRTCLVLRELEPEMDATAQFREHQTLLNALMDRKARLEYEYAQARLQQQRSEQSYGPVARSSNRELHESLIRYRAELNALDDEIAPLARESAELHNPRWGLLMRAGNDKSHLARQIERYADIYTSRVSNFVFETPFGYLRAPRGSLPHDPGWTADPWRARE